MAIRQLPDGRWTVYHRVDGKLRWEYFGRGPDAEQAARVRNESLRLLKRPRRSTGHGPTVLDAMQAYFNALRLTAADKTLQSTEYKIMNLLKIIGELAAAGLDHDDLDRYVSVRQNTVRGATIHAEIRVLKAGLNHAAKRGMIAANPIREYSSVRVDTPPARVISPQEFRLIYRAAAPHLRRALLIAWYTAVRVPGELVGLTWDCVAWERRLLFVASADKGGIRARNIPIHPALFSYLRRWKMQDGSAEHIIRYGGRRLKHIHRAFGGAVKRAGIQRRIKPYDLRHSAISAMLAGGADLKAVSELAGHSTPATTLRTYQHTNPAMHRAAIDTLPGFDYTGKASRRSDKVLELDRKTGGSGGP